MHKIRLRGPWEIQPVAAAGDAVAAVGSRRLQMPCSFGKLLEEIGGEQTSMSRFMLTRRFGRPASLSTDETVKLCLALSPDCHFRASSDVGSETGLSIIKICYNQSVLPAGGPQDSASAWVITDRLLPRNALEMVVAAPQAPASPSATPIFEVWLEFT